MGRGVGVLTLAVLCCFIYAEAVSVDTVLSKELEDVIKHEDLVISFKHIKARKRSKAHPETLFAVDFPDSGNKFSVLLDRAQNNVIIETIEDGRDRVQFFTVDTLEEESSIRSIILAVSQKQPGAQVTLFVDCVSYGMVATPKTMRDMFNKMDTPHLQLIRERKYHMEISKDGNLLKVLTGHHCPSSLITSHSKRSSLDSMFDLGSNKNELDFDPNVQAQQPLTTSYRGDIDLIASEDGILKALNELIITVNKHTHTIIDLQRFIESCGLCDKQNIEERRTCANTPPQCAPGVHCIDTNEGPRCGPCPRGFFGNGYECKPGYTCAERPCFEGVRCQDTAEGARCGPCPSGYTGDGFHCEEENSCRTRNPCYPGVQCYDTASGPRCGPCPRGYTGNGIDCSRESECDRNPCYPGVQCHDTGSGARCGACPRGYTGDGFQCTQDNSCTWNPCFHGVECRDTPSGAECGECPRGYVGDGRDCRPGRKCSDRPCFPGVRCDDTPHGAVCGPCPHGYSGNGEICRVVCEFARCPSGKCAICNRK